MLLKFLYIFNFWASASFLFCLSPASVLDEDSRSSLSQISEKRVLEEEDLRIGTPSSSETFRERNDNFRSVETVADAILFAMEDNWSVHTKESVSKRKAKRDQKFRSLSNSLESESPSISIKTKFYSRSQEMIVNDVVDIKMEDNQILRSFDQGEDLPLESSQRFLWKILKSFKNFVLRILRSFRNFFSPKRLNENAEKNKSEIVFSFKDPIDVEKWAQKLERRVMFCPVDVVFKNSNGMDLNDRDEKARFTTFSSKRIKKNNANPVEVRIDDHTITVSSWGLGMKQGELRESLADDAVHGSNQRQFFQGTVSSLRFKDSDVVNGMARVSFAIDGKIVQSFYREAFHCYSDFIIDLPGAFLENRTEKSIVFGEKLIKSLAVLLKKITTSSELDFLEKSKIINTLFIAMKDPFLSVSGENKFKRSVFFPIIFHFLKQCQRNKVDVFFNQMRFLEKFMPHQNGIYLEFPWIEEERDLDEPERQLFSFDSSEVERDEEKKLYWDSGNEPFVVFQDFMNTILNSEHLSVQEKSLFVNELFVSRKIPCGLFEHRERKPFGEAFLAEYEKKDKLDFDLIPLKKEFNRQRKEHTNLFFKWIFNEEDRNSLSEEDLNSRIIMNGKLYFSLEKLIEVIVHSDMLVPKEKILFMNTLSKFLRRDPYFHSNSLQNTSVFNRVKQFVDNCKEEGYVFVDQSVLEEKELSENELYLDKHFFVDQSVLEEKELYLEDDLLSENTWFSAEDLESKNARCLGENTHVVANILSENDLKTVITIFKNLFTLFNISKQILAIGGERLKSTLRNGFSRLLSVKNEDTTKKLRFDDLLSNGLKEHNFEKAHLYLKCFFRQPYYSQKDSSFWKSPEAIFGLKQDIIDGIESDIKEGRRNLSTKNNMRVSLKIYYCPYENNNTENILETSSGEPVVLSDQFREELNQWPYNFRNYKIVLSTECVLNNKGSLVQECEESIKCACMDLLNAQVHMDSELNSFS